MFNFRGINRVDDVLACVANGDYLYERNRVPVWWPWRVRLELGYPLGTFYITREAFAAMLRWGWIQDWGETFNDRIWAITDKGRTQIPHYEWMTDATYQALAAPPHTAAGDAPDTAQGE